jgi:integrase
MTRSRWAISYSELYRNYNYDSLNYVIDILDGFYSRYKEISENMGSTDPLRDKKNQMLRYEIIARFCQYAESLGAFIYGYRTNHLVRDKESKVLSVISGYKAKQIGDEFKALTKGQINRLWKDQEQLLEDIFGYHKIIQPEFLKSKRESLYNIKKLLKEVYDCYRFYQDSYNSYKHGYRLWFARDQKSRDAVVYIPTIRYNRKRRYIVPSDDDTLSVVMRSVRYCRQLFDILIENERQMRTTRKKIYNINISFLKKINNDFVIDKQIIQPKS